MVINFRKFQALICDTTMRLMAGEQTSQRSPQAINPDQHNHSPVLYMYSTSSVDCNSKLDYVAHVLDEYYCVDGIYMGQ